MILVYHCISLIAQLIFSPLFRYKSISDSLKCCFFFSPLFGFTQQNIYIFFVVLHFFGLHGFDKPANTPHCAEIVKCAWENSDVSLSVQDVCRLHLEIVTSAAASRFAHTLNGVLCQSARRTSNGGCALT